MSNSVATPLDPDLHNEHYLRGWQLIDGLILLDGTGPMVLTWFRRRRLRNAIGEFRSALGLNPRGWQSMCALGKIYQRLGDHAEALEWFRRARRIDPAQAAVAREAGIEALEMHELSYAEECFRLAIRDRPGDAGLVSNLALAQLLGGSVEEARNSVSEAIARNPDDKIARRVLRAVERVRTGRSPVPVNMSQLRRLAK